MFLKILLQLENHRSEGEGTYTFSERSLHWQFKNINTKVMNETSKKLLRHKLETSCDLSATAKNEKSLLKQFTVER